MLDLPVFGNENEKKKNFMIKGPFLNCFLDWGETLSLSITVFTLTSYFLMC